MPENISPTLNLRRARLGTEEPDAIDALLSRWHAERPDLDATPLAILGRLHQAYMRYYFSAGLVVERFALNMATFDILVRLRTAGPPYRMTAGGLAQSGFITPGGITQRVDRLVEAKLVRRVREPDDRRVVFVQLTPHGRRVIDEAVGPHFANEELMLTELDKEDRVILAELLKKLLASIGHGAMSREELL